MDRHSTFDFRSIVKYPSIFGYYGIMTTEIDHIVVTNGAIFVFETKNQELKEWNLKEPEGVLINNETEIGRAHV